MLVTFNTPIKNRSKICFIFIFQEAEEEKVLRVRDVPGKKNAVENTLTS